MFLFLYLWFLNIIVLVIEFFLFFIYKILYRILVENRFMWCCFGWNRVECLEFYLLVMFLCYFFWNFYDFEYFKEKCGNYCIKKFENINEDLIKG